MSFLGIKQIPSLLKVSQNQWLHTTASHSNENRMG